MVELRRKPDRRAHQLGRVVSGGRRMEDAVLSTTCRTCGSRDLDAMPGDHGTVALRCQSCNDAWVVLPEHARTR
jgi:hypothetical protein